MNLKHYRVIFAFLCAFILVGCKTTKNEYDDAIPKDILLLMRTLPGFNLERDLYDISTISGWFVDDDSDVPYGLIDAELVNFEWEDYSGTQKKSLFRDFNNARKYTDYIQWLSELNKRQNLLTVTINPNTQNAMLLVSRNLNFPVKFSYELEFENQIIFNFSNDECVGSETIGADLIEENGIYRVKYNIDGFESSVTFSIRK